MNPNQLFRLFESGEIERDELQERMGVLARELIVEMEEERGNPIAAYIDRVRNLRASKKWVKQHGEASVRELFFAMSEVEDFSPALILWNAEHWDVPLHCFFRQKRDPVFRVCEMQVKMRVAEVVVEYGVSGDIKKERFCLKRDWQGKMEVVERESL